MELSDLNGQADTGQSSRHHDSKQRQEDSCGDRCGSAKWQQHHKKRSMKSWRVPDSEGGTWEDVESKGQSGLGGGRSIWRYDC